MVRIEVVGNPPRYRPRRTEAIDNGVLPMFMSNGKKSRLQSGQSQSPRVLYAYKVFGQLIVFLWHYAFNLQAGKIVFFGYKRRPLVFCPEWLIAWRQRLEISAADKSCDFRGTAF